MRISDWSSDVCSSDLQHLIAFTLLRRADQLVDRGRLVAGGLIVADQVEALAALDLVGARGAVRDIGVRGVDLVERSANLDDHGRQYGSVADRKSTRLNSSH